MSKLHFPWLEVSVLAPLLGAIWVAQQRDADRARRWSVGFSAVSLACVIAAWCDFATLHSLEANDGLPLVNQMFHGRLFVMDHLSAPLLPLAALLNVLTAWGTLSTKIRRFSFAWMLMSQAILLAMLSCKAPWGIVTLLALATLPPYFELRARQKPTGVYVSHMGLFVVLLIGGWTIFQSESLFRPAPWWAMLPLLLAIMIRSGFVPVHCWMTDLFENATFGTALGFVTPIPGAYAALRLVLPAAPDWVLHSLGLISLATAFYAAGMAFVQQEARRLYCYLFLSHSALVFVGLESATPIGLTGALCVWLSIALALTGFGLTLRALEARHGRLSLAKYHGLYEHTPALAICFLLTGLASVGFPGTFGFIGTELLVEGAVHTYPYIGVAVVVVAALNGIAVVQAYFRLFTGTRHFSVVPLGISARERFAVLVLAALILVGGLFPQPGVVSRHEAALELLQNRVGDPQVGLHNSKRAVRLN